MTELLAALAVVLMALGLVGVVMPLLPGMPLLFGGMLLAAWLGDFARVGWPTLALLAGLGIAAWTLDYLAAVWGVRRAGASGQAVVGAGIGAVVGLFGGLPGLVVGPIAGAVIGEYLARRDEGKATRAGLAAGISFIVAAVAKLAIAFAMLGIFAFAYFV